MKRIKMNITNIASLTLLFVGVIFLDHTPLPRGKHDPKSSFSLHIMNHM